MVSERASADPHAHSTGCPRPSGESIVRVHVDAGLGLGRGVAERLTHVEWRSEERRPDRVFQVVQRALRSRRRNVLVRIHCEVCRFGDQLEARMIRIGSARSPSTRGARHRRGRAIAGPGRRGRAAVTSSVARTRPANRARDPRGTAGTPRDTRAATAAVACAAVGGPCRTITDTARIATARAR